jgi:hypothetical protein
MTPMEIRVRRSTEISDFEWLFHIYRRDGQFQAIICNGTQEADPVEPWQPELDGEDAYRFYCEMYLDNLLGNEPEKAYGYCSELIYAVELLDDGEDEDI